MLARRHATVPAPDDRRDRVDALRREGLVIAAGKAPTWQSLVVLVPAIVIGGGMAIAVFAVLGRSLVADIRESGHARAIYAGVVAVLVIGAALTYLGIKLPKE